MCQACNASPMGIGAGSQGRARSFVGDLSPYSKLAVLCCGLLLNLASPSPVTSALLAAACLILLLGTGTGPRLLARRLVVPWYIAAVAVAVQVFLSGSTPIFQIGPLTGYSEGLARGAELGGRILGGTALVLAFGLTVPVTELLSLASRLRLSPVLIEIGSLTYRYLFLLGEEAQRIRDAQVARLGHSSWRTSVQSYGSLIGMVMARSYDKAEGVYQAMVVRGYCGVLPVETCKAPGANDFLAVALALSFMGCSYVAGVAYGV